MIITRWIRACAARKPAPATAAGQYRERHAPCGEREAGHEEGYADVLDEMRVKGTCFGYPRNGFVPEGTGSEHRQSVKERGYCENCCYQTPHGNLLRPRRAMRGGCDGTGQRNFRA